MGRGKGRSLANRLMAKYKCLDGYAFKKKGRDGSKKSKPDKCQWRAR